MKELGRRFWLIYLTFTLCFFLALGILILRFGSAGFYAIQDHTMGSYLIFNFIVFCISWLFIGLVLWLSQFPDFVRSHLVFLIVFVLIGFSYLNVVREPHLISYGDFRPYFLAAVDISRDQPMNQNPDRPYLYPPLLATLISPFVSLGEDRLAKAFHLLNYFALLLMMVLLYLTLQRYRFSKEVAAIALACILAANVPISRTLIYHQVNLHVANLILLSLILFEKHGFWSAFSLSLAIHLKVYPVVLVFPFLYQKQWRWCACFVVSQVILITGTSMLGDPRYYLQFFSGIVSINETELRNVSVDSLVYNTLRLFNLDLGDWGKAIAHVLRLALAIGVLRAYSLLINRNLFADVEGTRRVILNSYAILLLLIIAVSPTIWPHYFVLLKLTMLVLFSTLKRPREMWLYLFAYMFIFLFPVYDIYPVSYLRLVAIVLLIYLLNAAANREVDSEPDWFRNLKGRLAFV